ncbi:hypothetical protein [Dankookia sp. P2]|uniref:hypothetical protein n=1 Tax=Dankookia sp. P2 TaxID=3423955 RepID=UPI003D677712
MIAAATFWTWLWGPIGLLLAVPLTVCLVVLGRHVDRLEFLEVMLGDSPPLDPEETFYQRALAGDADALAEQADKCLKEKSLAEFLDGVALPALRLAQADAVHGALSPDRRDALQRSVELLIEDLEEAEELQPEGGAAAEAPPAVPATWHVPGAVLCLPGRGPFDALAAVMLGQVLQRRGFGVQIGGLAAGPGAPPKLLCLCLIEGGSSAATARYLLRRARRRLPGTPALALAWGPESDGTLSAALRAESQAQPLLLASSLAEALDLAAEQAGQAAPPVLTTPAPRPEAPRQEPDLGVVAAPA